MSELPRDPDSTADERRKRQLIQAARLQADGAADETATHRASDATPNSGKIQIRCPSCHTPVEVAVDTSFTDLTCDACGSHFSLVDQEQATRLAPSLSKLGRFELIERIGVGGFGSVWKARDKELDRTVAIKVPRQGGMTAEEQEKFLREARAAAQLKHPNIVSVHEVGRDGDSVFIVSDFVRGVTLGDWLTGQMLTSREAAELTAKIADALHHAHEQGVVHRDLKPANIMIDGNSQPHLMDFGLARREVGEVTMTVDGHVLGTPAYMSPEQAIGASHRADRRSDVYSLGVVLFQLLTGELPFRGNARMLVHQVINDEPPSPRKFNAAIPKDLETITLKCLEKEPSRRYQSARELGEELQRHLKGEPIRARPTGMAVRTWRWCRRKPTAAASLALLLMIVAGLLAAFFRERSLRQEIVAKKNEAEMERSTAQALASFLTDDVLAKASPQEMPDKSVRDVLVKTLIEPAAPMIDERFRSQPLVAASIHNSLAEILQNLGRSDLALVHAERSLNQRRELLGEDHQDTAVSLGNYAWVLQSSGRVSEAEPLFGQALEKNRKLLGEKHPSTVVALKNYGNSLNLLGRSAEAQPLLKQALEQNRELLGERHPASIRTLNDYAWVLESLGRRQEAKGLYKNALELSSEVNGRNHPDTIRLLVNYAYILLLLDRREEAETLFKDAVSKSREILGEKHPVTIEAIDKYAGLIWLLDRKQEAEALAREALQKYREVLGEEHPDTIRALGNYAVQLYALGRHQESVKLFKLAIKQSRTTMGASHPDTLRFMSDFATAYVTSKQFSESAKVQTELHKQIRDMHRRASPYEQYWAATAAIGAGELKENRQICHELLLEYVSTHDMDVASRMVYAYVVAAIPASEIEQVISAAEAVKNHFPGNERVLGAVLYRAGRYQDALTTFSNAHKKFNPVSWDYCFLAMIESSLEQHVDASEMLEVAQQIHRAGEDEWFMHLETEVLLKEAASKVHDETGLAE